MYLRFHRSLGIFPGLRLNLNKGGVSLTGGVRGAHVTLGKNGLTTSMGIPGTGLSVRDKIPFTTPRPDGPSANGQISTPAPHPHASEDGQIQIPTSLWNIIEAKPKFWKALLVQEGLKLTVETAIPEWERATKIGMDVGRFGDWLRHKMDELKGDIARLLRTCNDLTDAFVPPNEAYKLCTALQELTAIVEDLIGWEEEVRGFVDHPLYCDVASSLVGSSKLIIDEIAKVKANLDQQILSHLQGGLIDLELHIRLPEGWGDELDGAIARLKMTSPELREVASERVQVSRGETRLGFFGLRTIQENLEAGIFLEDDWFWSADLNDWRPMKDLKAPRLASATVSGVQSQAVP